MTANESKKLGTVKQDEHAHLQQLGLFKDPSVCEREKSPSESRVSIVRNKHHNPPTT
jgi:hypothetical protein